MRKRQQLREKLTYANVMVTILAIIVLGGGVAYGASHLGKNSVGSKQLKKNAVTTAKIKKEAVTAAKVRKGTLTGTQINVAKLGTVPNASHADSISPAEPTHKVGAPGEPSFQWGSENAPALGPLQFESVGFYKDHEGIVHLQGVAKVGTGGTMPGEIFVLPPGYRPASGTLMILEQFKESAVEIFGSNVTAGSVVLDGKLIGAPGKSADLDGITFRAES